MSLTQALNSMHVKISMLLKVPICYGQSWICSKARSCRSETTKSNCDNKRIFSFTLQHMHESTVLSLQLSSNLPTSLLRQARSYKILWHITHTMHKADSTQKIRAFWWLIPRLAVVIQTEKASWLQVYPQCEGISEKMECIGNHNNIKTTFKTITHS
jgi:hypothetical protein